MGWATTGAWVAVVLGATPSASGIQTHDAGSLSDLVASELGQQSRATTLDSTFDARCTRKLPPPAPPVFMGPGSRVFWQSEVPDAGPQPKDVVVVLLVGDLVGKPVLGVHVSAFVGSDDQSGIRFFNDSATVYDYGDSGRVVFYLPPSLWRIKIEGPDVESLEFDVGPGNHCLEVRLARESAVKAFRDKLHRPALPPEAPVEHAALPRELCRRCATLCPDGGTN